jgi:carbon monoxide dehydrogenase subunit G
MRLDTQFIVGAPLERVWPALRDAGIFADCLPGSKLRPADELYAGRLELAANGSPITCEATLRALDDDEDEHVATVLLRGRQLGGPGVGSATIQARCEEADSATRVTLSATVLSSGLKQPLSEFERPARKLFEQAADVLKERAATAPAPQRAAPEEAKAPPAAGRGPEMLPVRAPAQKRLGLALGVAGGAVIAVAVARRLLGRRHTGLW